MKTLRLKIDPTNLQTQEAAQTLDRAAGILRAGGLVALPTETVYGLGANALDTAAIARIFAAKGRPAWDPVIVHIGDETMLAGLVTEVPEVARKLMKAFWPGPLTLLLPRSHAVPETVTAGRRLVGLRMPADPVALELIRRARVPVAAPSANVFGHISPTSAEHVLHDLDGRIDAVLDAGATMHGVESTVLDPNQYPVVIYRPGAVTAAQIEEVAGAVELFQSDPIVADAAVEALPSPGVGIRHYAPKAPMVLIEAPLAELKTRIAAEAEKLRGEKIGLMLPDEVSLPESLATVTVFCWGRWLAPKELASRLYAGLRDLDAKGCTVILCPVPNAEGIGTAIRDRLLKAGTKRMREQGAK